MGTLRLVFDDDCGFCTWWAEFIEAHGDVELVGYSELTSEVRERLPADYRKCSHLVTDEAVYSCGASIEEALARSDVWWVPRSLVDRLRRLGPYGTLREWGYRNVAHNRSVAGRLVSKAPPARDDDSPAGESR